MFALVGPLEINAPKSSDIRITGKSVTYNLKSNTFNSEFWEPSISSS